MGMPVRQLDIYPYYGRIVAAKKGFRKLIYSILPRHTFAPLRSELHIALVRLKSRNVPQRYCGARDLLVNLGAGDQGRPGWVNVDVYPAPGVNCLYDCRTKMPFPDQSVRGVFCEHFLEHIDYTEEIPFFLSECHRILQPGGVMRIIVPDMEKYLRAYCTENWTALATIRPLEDERVDYYYRCRYHTKMELINMLFRQGYEHKYAFDFDTLKYLLETYGFSHVQRQDFGRSLLAELCLDQPQRASESLYVEAVK